MNFYVATGLERADEAKTLAAALAAMGHTQTYDWTAHGSVQDEGPERIAEVAVEELRGVGKADLFIALLPGGRGTHTEFGCALALAMDDDDSVPANSVVARKRLVVLVGPTEDASGRTCAFYLHPRVDERFATVGELHSWLRGLRRSGVRYG